MIEKTIEKAEYIALPRKIIYEKLKKEVVWRLYVLEQCKDIYLLYYSEACFVIVLIMWLGGVLNSIIITFWNEDVSR